MLTRNLFLLFLVLPLLLGAQQSSSKSKSKDKLYEKEGSKQIELKNSVLVNSPNLEFSPVYYQNGLVYVSSRYNAGAKDKKIGETYFELFYSELDALGNPTKPQEFSVNINSMAHEGPVSFSANGKHIFFTRNNMQKGISKADSKGVVRLKVYQADRGPFDWENIREMPFNSDEYSVMHPTLSTDGKTLYFSSDMPGGVGGYDLYKVEKNGARWSDPENLGIKINTPGNDVFPFIHLSNTLFFCSDGHEGYGGLDLYKTDLSNPNSIAPVINMGRPFNSEDDDLGFILNEEGTQGYFTSGRPGGVGKDDIYQFKAPDGLEGLGEKPVQNSKLIVFDEKTGQRLPNAGIRIFERAEDGFLDGNDAYEVDLQPVAEGSSELVMKLRRKDAGALGSPDFYTGNDGTYIHPLEIGKKYIILVTKEGYLNGELLASGEKLSAELRIPLKENRCFTVNGQLTDNSNRPLTNAAVIIENKCDGSKEELVSTTNGYFTACLPVGCSYVAEYRKGGFLTGKREISLQEDNAEAADLSFRLSPATVSNPIVKEPIRRGSVIVLENIYYDFNKSAIRSGEARELEGLASLMEQYPSMKIDLIAHTDSRGTAEYNMDLSMQRAESAKLFLVNRGIRADRINAFGYGETQPRNGCVDGVRCKEKEYQYNRRTEVRVTDLNDEVDVRYKGN